MMCLVSRQTRTIYCFAIDVVEQSPESSIWSSNIRNRDAEKQNRVELVFMYKRRPTKSCFGPNLGM